MKRPGEYKIPNTMVFIDSNMTTINMPFSSKFLLNERPNAFIQTRLIAKDYKPTPK